jgi:tetratricopeptide (TPR) repeat protein
LNKNIEHRIQNRRQRIKKRMKEDRRQNRILLLISAGLVLATLIAYEPIRHNDFVDYDDNTYITENPDVSSGLTLHSIYLAFTKTHYYMWHPLTTLSHMLDCQIFELNPLGHHLVSVTIHIINVLLVLWIFTAMTGAVWPSAFIAMVFALHPLQVESVAWAAERKTVLSGLFWLLTIAAYIWYAKQPVISRYIVVFMIYALCIMTKPVVVTLPFVLVLLDFWPLNRIRSKNSEFKIENEELKGKNLNSQFTILNSIYEKVPLLALSGILCVITFIVQNRAGSVMSLELWPLHIRLINAMASYFDYVAKMLYPVNLAVLYPFLKKPEINQAVLAVMGIAVLLRLWGQGRRWLVMGLLWYLGALVPAIGIIQSGSQAMADRYVYLPSIGILIIMAWGAKEIFSKIPFSKLILTSCAAVALIAMTLTTRSQLGYWKDSGTLCKRALDVTQNNFVMENNYGEYLFTHNQYDEGIRHFQEALRIWPEYPDARMNICHALLILNKLDEAINCYNEALQTRTGWLGIHEVYYNLGWAYEQKNNISLAETNYRKALELKPDFKPAQDGLASVQAKQRQSTNER